MDEAVGVVSVMRYLLTVTTVTDLPTWMIHNIYHLICPQKPQQPYALCTIIDLIVKFHDQLSLFL